ncbi:MAG: ATP-binding cassette domain-containing protein [Pseudomonadota bacterium]|nr:ATP-binding cassette domain-containing protein [Pseudomonadota bacterium]
MSPPPDLILDLASVHAGGVPILGALSFAVRAGETLALTGPSGIGKSTLLRVIAGLHRGYQGSVTGPATQGRIAMVFQDPNLLPWRSARDHLTLTTRCTPDQAAHWLGAVGLGDKPEHMPRQLSLGQQRRLALARAFAARPGLLLLDEPFVSLDPALADEMMTLFEDLRATHPVTTLLVTHDTREADRLADRILRLHGSPARLAGAA